MYKFEDVSLTTLEILRNNGYDYEVHRVVTEDGYVLELHRIPRSKTGKKPTRNHPVYFHHGILGSSADWVLGGASISLPMQLADDGYDVWMANCRGNTYSKDHVSMNNKERAYWNFSLHEIGKYDLPAAIDYILTNTNSSQLQYIGFSMGTCVFFIMASERPEYQPKIRSQISLAPVAFLSNTRSSLRYIAPYAKIMNVMFEKFFKGQIMPQSKMQTFLASTLCRERLTQKLICEKCIIFSVCGSDPKFFDTKLIPYIMGHFPAGTSSKLAAHFAQFIMKDTFGQYDYGAIRNLQLYNSTEPPTYDLESIQVPVTLIYGPNDILADETDVFKLKSKLPKVVDIFPVNCTYFNHVDFLWSLNVNEQVNDPVKEMLRKTDDAGWRYTGRCSAAATQVGNDATDGGHADDNAIGRLPEPTSGVLLMSHVDYLIDNLDVIIAGTMPRTVDADDLALFERERELQKALFGNLFRALKYTEANYGRIRDEIANEIYDWTDDVAAGVASGVAGARNAVETHVRRTKVMINGKVAYAGKFVANGLARAESSVASGLARAESSVANGVAIAEGYVVGGVNRAEQSVVDGIGRAEHFVNYGLNKTDRTVGNALNTVFRRLNRAFWFLK